MSVRKLASGRWEARVRVEGRHLKKTFTRKTDADAWEAKTRHDRDRGITVDLSNRTTVAEHFAQWLEVRSLRPGSRRAYATLLNVHLVPVPLGAPAGARPPVRGAGVGHRPRRDAGPGDGAALRRHPAVSVQQRHA
jgi:hypothetical protein